MKGGPTDPPNHRFDELDLRAQLRFNEGGAY